MLEDISNQTKQTNLKKINHPTFFLLQNKQLLDSMHKYNGAT